MNIIIISTVMAVSFSFTSNNYFSNNQSKEDKWCIRLGDSFQSHCPASGTDYTTCCLRTQEMFSTFLPILSVDGTLPRVDDLWHGFGVDCEVSDNIGTINPYYSAWQHASAHMDQHVFALNMRKINQGQLNNPEGNLPGDASEYKLVLTWTSAAASTARFDLVVIPVKKDGDTLCDKLDFVDYNSNGNILFHHLYYFTFYVQMLVEQSLELDST